MGAWAVRFRIAALACCGAVVVLIVAGLVAGLTYSLPTAPGTTVPHGFAAQARVQTLLTGTNLFTATLLVIALLLLVVARVERVEGEPAPDAAVGRVAMVLAAVVVIGALANGAVTVWYFAISSENLPVVSMARPLGEAIAGAVVALAAAWWARALVAQ